MHWVSRVGQGDQLLKGTVAARRSDTQALDFMRKASMHMARLDTQIRQLQHDEGWQTSGPPLIRANQCSANQSCSSADFWTKRRQQNVQRLRQEQAQRAPSEGVFAILDEDLAQTDLSNSAFL